MYTVGLTWLVLPRQVPWWELPGSVLLDMVTFFACWQDKHAAKKGRWP
jgi:hypothetical protein